MIIKEKTSNCAKNEDSSFQKFLLLFIIGVALIFLGITILMITAAFSGGQTNFGAIVFIGPIPIVVGAGPQATLMILFAIILAVLSIIVFLTSHRKLTTPNQQDQTKQY
jgi:uncharacterized membrane protein